MNEFLTGPGLSEHVNIIPGWMIVGIGVLGIVVGVALLYL